LKQTRPRTVAVLPPRGGDLAVILRLGCGKAAGRGCGPKAALLDRAAQAGLPVPPGVIVLDEAWHSALARGLVRLEGAGSRQAVSVPDPTLLVHLLGLPPLDTFLAVRSAFSLEDGTADSLAGAFVTGLFVDGRRSAAVAAGLAGVWSSGLGRPPSLRRDVIVQAMVVARNAGVAFTEREHEDDLVNATEGTAEGLLAGQVAGESYRLPKRRRWDRPTEASGLARRLQTLLRDVGRVFGEADWDVEWADDGQHIWLVQVRVVTRSTRRNEVFTAASHRELLPDPPSRFTTSLIASCADELFGYYRRFDPSLPCGRPLIEVFRHRPFFNLTLLTEMMRRWGLPTRLVTSSIGGAADRDFGAQPARLLLHLPVLARLARAQLGAVRSADQTREALLERTAVPPPRLADLILVLRSVYVSLVTEMFSLTAAISGPLALLRWAGVLADVGLRWQTAGTEILDDLAPLQARVAERPELARSLERGELPDDEEFRLTFTRWLERHGHRGTYESDLARPRYREEPSVLLRSLAAAGRPRPAPPPTLRARLLAPVVWQAEGTVRARERLHSTAMMAFERIRSILLTRARQLTERGVLPAPEAIWDLEVGEVARLEDDFLPDEGFWRARRDEIETARGFDLPSLFHRFDDLDEFRARSAREASPTRLRGIGLTRGEVRGRAWVLSEPSVEPPEELRSAGIILVARAVDAGWIPTFTGVAGVVVETGGDLSHGSIVLREMGLPAVTNVRHATRALRTGDLILLRADEGAVERLGPEPSAEG
jgi:phosphohistidine swiveling domain-containing protein